MEKKNMETDLLFVELQTVVSRQAETEQRMEQMERAMRQMKRMMEEKIIEHERTINIGEDINQEHK